MPGASLAMCDLSVTRSGGFVPSMALVQKSGKTSNQFVTFEALNVIYHVVSSFDTSIDASVPYVPSLLSILKLKMLSILED